ncbi:MAG: methyl-accepting chemotaxis protein [Deltaproteobacteria bacterium]|nr:methyl-accepting chemotaxis protein [Deltaproteobacteria bacterium]
MKFKTKITIANVIITLIAVAAIYYVTVKTISFTMDVIKFVSIVAGIIVVIALSIQYLASIRPFSIIEEFSARVRNNKTDDRFTRLTFYTVLYFPLYFMAVSAAQWYVASIVFFILLYGFEHTGLTIALRTAFAIISGATIANIFQYFVYQRLTEPRMREVQRYLKGTEVYVKKRIGIVAKIFFSLFVLMLLFLVFIRTISNKLIEDIFRSNGVSSAKVELAAYAPAISSILSQRLPMEQTAIALSRFKLGSSGYVLVMDDRYKDVFHVSDNYENAVPLDELAAKDTYNDFKSYSTLIKAPLSDGFSLVGVYAWSDYMPSLSKFSDSQNWLLLTMALILTIISLFIAIDIYLPVKAIGSVVEKLTMGNFSTTSGLFVEDEAGVAANALRKMIENIKSVIKVIKSSSANITGISDRMMDTIDGTRENMLVLDREVKNNAGIITSVQSTLSQLAEYIDGLLNSIHDTLASSHKLEESIESGGKILAETKVSIDALMDSGDNLLTKFAAIQRHTADSMGDISLDGYGHLRNVDMDNEEIIRKIRTTIDWMADSLNKLGSELHANVQYRKQMGNILYKVSALVSTLDEHVNKIVVDLNKIDLVIDDTNLLAMNSSVISAQAGDSGRGFDVVSEEVTKLASVTQDKIIEVRSLTGLLVKEKDTIMSNMKEKQKFLDAFDGKLGLFDNEISAITGKVGDLKLEYEQIVKAVNAVSLGIHGLLGHAVSGRDVHRLISAGLIRINKAAADINKHSKAFRESLEQLSGGWSAYSEGLGPVSSALSAITEPATMINDHMKAIKDRIGETQGLLDRIAGASQRLNDQIGGLEVREELEKLVVTINEEPREYRII